MKLVSKTIEVGTSVIKVDFSKEMNDDIKKLSFDFDSHLESSLFIHLRVSKRKKTIKNLFNK